MRGDWERRPDDQGKARALPQHKLRAWAGAGEWEGYQVRRKMEMTHHLEGKRARIGGS